jgi:hypothetical protein
MREVLSVPRAGSWLVLIATVLIVMSGCDGAAAPTAPDPEEAKQLLEHVLGAWQKGETVEAMKQASPSIVVSDSKWKRGDKLTKFELTSPGKPFGAQQVFRVRLWLTNDKNKEVKDEAQYEVGTQPIRTVFRSLFD